MPTATLSENKPVISRINILLKRHIPFPYSIDSISLNFPAITSCSITMEHTIPITTGNVIDNTSKYPLILFTEFQFENE